MGSMLKRFLSMLLVVCMVFPYMIPGASAAEETEAAISEPTVQATVAPMVPQEPTVQATVAPEPTAGETEPMATVPSEGVSNVAITGISLAPNEMYFETGGATETKSDGEGNETSYYCYYWVNNAQLTFHFSDGTSQTPRELFFGSFEFNGQWYHLETSDGQLDEPWTAGNSYPVALRLVNETTEEVLTAESTVEILESPLFSISASRITLNEGVHVENAEYNNNGETAVWQRYNWEDYISYTLTFTDGQQISGTGSGFEYNGQRYYFNITDSQTPETLWSAGTNEQVSISIMGKTRTFRVVIEESPLLNMDIQQIQIPANTEGHWENEEVDGQTISYWRYDWQNQLEYTMTLLIGSEQVVYEGQGGCFEYQGQPYSFTLYDDQSYDNQWQPGGVYTVSVEALGKRFDTQVTIEESPVASAVIHPVSLYPYSEGENRHDDNGEAYYHYSWQHRMWWSVTFTDGQQINGSGASFDYEGQCYEFETAQDQNAKNQWQAGGTYNTSATLAGIQIPVSVTILESPIQSVSVNPVTLYENQDCNQQTGWSEQLQQETPYIHYNWSEQVQYTITYKDGTVYESRGSSFEYQGEWYPIYYMADQGPDNQWTPGGSYSGTVRFFDKELSVDIQMLASTVDRIELGPVSVYKGLHTSIAQAPVVDEYGNVIAYKDYTRYLWWDQLSYTVYFNDGSEPVSGTGTVFEYNGQQFSFQFNEGQDPDNQWQPGYTYDVSVSAMGVSASTTVTVYSSPVTNMVINPISIVENTGGSLWNAGTAEEFYFYEWQNYMDFTIWFVDGTTYSGRGTWFEYQETGYNLEWDYPQNANNPWTVGNTYSVAVRVFGQETQAQVTIVPSPIESICFAPMSLIENSDGEIRSQYNPDTGMYDTQYYHYYWWNKLSYTVTFSDGTEPITGVGTGFHYNDQYYGFSYDDPQDSGTVMTVGNTYTCQVSTAGISAPVEITITESPLESIVMSPASFVENTGGWIDHRWDETTQSDVSYYYYAWNNRVNVTLTFKDGNVFTIRPYERFEYNGQSYSLDSYTEVDSQWNDPWQAGNSYTVQTSFMGQSAQAQVTIEKLPVQSISFGTVNIKEYENGNWEYPMIDGVQQSFFRYHWSNQIPYTITFEDGSSQSGTGNGFSYNDEWIPFTVDDPQSYQNPFLAGNTYAIPVTVGSITENVYVNIYTSYQENGWEYMVQDGNAFITQCYNHESILVVPDTLGGYPVAGIISLDNVQGIATEIVIPDSVTMLGADLFSGWGWRETLRKVTIGAGVTELSMEMFAWCTMLEAVEVSPANTTYCSEDGVVFDMGKTTVVVFPYGKTGNYTIPQSVVNADVIMNNLSNLKVTIDFNELEGYTKLDDVIFNEDMTVIYSCDADKTGSYVIPSTVTTINRFAFANSRLTEVTIPEGVTEIAYYAFHGSPQLQRVNIPQSVTSIGQRAFEGCTNLTVADLPSNLQSLGVRAFAETAVQNVVIPGSLKEVSWSAFQGAAVSNLTISEGVESIDSNAFAYSGVQSVVLPDSLTSLGYNAFSNCHQLSSLTIGKGLQVVTSCAFINTGLTSVVIPENIEYIGSSAFAYCSQLKNVTFMNEAVSFGDGAFKYSGLETLDLSDQLTSIEWEVFRGTQLKEVTIPDSVTAITYKAFADCTQLMDIDIPDGLQELWGNAFENTAWYNSQPDGPVYLEHFYYGYKGEVPKGAIISIPQNITHLSFGESFSNGFSAVVFQGDAPVNAEFYDVTVIYPVGNTTWQDYIANGEYTDTTFVAALHSGTCGDSLGWVLGEDGTLRIFGFGRMYDFIYGGKRVKSASTVAPWYEYNDSITSIEIGEDVEYVGSFAFADCPATTVSFTGEAPEIGTAAFYNVTATATYPTGYDSWTDNATGNYGGNITWDALDTEVASGTCGENLTWVLDESGTLTVSGTGEMYSYTRENTPWVELLEQIQRVYISDGVTSLGGGAFRDCTRLSYVRLPESLLRIEHGGTFQYCEKLESIDLPENLQSIGSEAFQSSGLTEVVIPDSVTSMGGYVFANCYKLTRATVGSGLSMLESYAFAWCENLQSVTVSEGVVDLTRYVFQGCQNLKELTIPESVTSISDSVFSNSGLEEITIPRSVTQIGYAAFRRAYNLHSITFTGAAPSIDWTAFEGVSADAYFPGNEPGWGNVVGNGFGGSLRWKIIVNYLAEGQCGDNLTWRLADSGVLDIEGDGPMYDYEAGTAPWYQYKDQIDIVNLHGTSSVGDYAFYGCENIQNVNNWGSLVSYGDYSFYGCKNLTYVQESAMLAVIGDYAFAGCTGLMSFPFTGNLRNIGQYAFEDCNGLYDLHLPDTVNSIGQYAFSGCSNLRSAWLPASMTGISNGMFSGCTNLNDVHLHEGITHIGAEAFMNCKRLTEIHLPNTLEYIGDFAFFGCNGLTSLVIPSKVTYVGSYAMHNCTSMEELYFTGNMPQFGYQPLSNVSGVVNYPTNAEGWSEDALAGLGGSFQPEPYEKYFATIISEGEYLRSYTTLQDALNDCDPTCQYIVLQEDQNVAVTLTRDVYLDLNGKKLTGTITTNGHTIYGMDSMTDGYSSYGMGIFSCTDENGQEIVPEKLVYVTAPVREQPMRYMSIRDEQGWSFHRFYLGITHTSLQIANLGLGYKATFCGDDMVAMQMDSYGYKLQIEGGKPLERSKKVQNFVSGKTLTLLVKNWDVEKYGQRILFAQVTLKLKDGTLIESHCYDTSLRRVIEAVNANASSYSQQTISALEDLINDHPVMKDWLVDNLYREPAELVADAYALAVGEYMTKPVTLTGTVTQLNAIYDPEYGDVTLTMTVDGAEDMPIMCYRLNGDGADQIGMGDRITVNGVIQNYNGTIEFSAGCSLLSWEDLGAVTAPSDPAQILQEAYLLEEGQSLPYIATLTGTVIHFNDVYNSFYNYITVTMVVEGAEDKPILCYHLKGDDADQIGVNDVITVAGVIKNHYGTVEFTAPCLLKAWEDREGPAVPEDPIQIVQEAYGLAEGVYLPYAPTLTGTVIRVDMPYNSEENILAVTIAVEGAEDKPILCSIVDGEGMDRVGVGQKITVTGFVANFFDTIQFVNGILVDCGYLPTVVHPGNFASDYQYVIYKMSDYDGQETLNKTTITPNEGIWVEGHVQTPQYNGQPSIEYNGQAWYGATGAGDELSFSMTDTQVVFSVNDGEGFIYCEVLSNGTLRVVEADFYLSAGDILTPVYE